MPGSTSFAERPTLVDLLFDRAVAAPRRTAYVFLRDGETEAARWSWGDTAAAARGVAARLLAAGAAPGDRALLLYPSGLDFVAAFLGCLAARVVAVPAYPPRPGRSSDSRLAAIAQDAEPRWVLSTAALAARRQAAAEGTPALAAAIWIPTDLPDAPPAAGGLVPPREDDLAFLQYTSGSTADPKGVEITHGNLAHNEEAIRRAFAQSEASVVVGWLPLFHDMGLIGNVLQPLWCGGSCVLMSPAAFLHRPRRWLEAISRYRGTTSGGPDFAYDLCARRAAGDLAGLDLSSWRLAYSGAEPVRAQTLARFAQAFAPAGFDPAAFFPCYGLAEATLFASGGTAGEGAHVEAFAPRALEEGRAEPAAAAGRALVACGAASLGQRLVVVDPETGERRPPGQVGEIWIAGPSVARGYFRRPDETARDFGARLAGDAEAGPFLRTGDLGFLHAGRLFVAGRLKDLVILRGRNLHPQDVERTAEAAHPALRPGGGAAFAVEGGEAERLVLVHELASARPPEGGVAPLAAEIALAVRRAVAEEHEAQLHDLVLIPPATLPRTTSGKVRRAACRAAYVAGELPALATSPLAATAGAEEAGDEPGAAELLALPPEERPALLLASLRRRAARAMRLPPEALPPRDSEPPLTALGLDSLAALELRGGLEADFGAAPPLERLLGGASLGEVAAWLLDRLEPGAAADAPPPPRPEPIDPAASYPLSHGQRALWFLEQLHPETTAFLLIGAARARGPLDASALGRAFTAAAARHPALYTTFEARRGEPRQRVRSADGCEPAEIVIEDAAEWDDERVAARWHDLAYRPFDLARGPLARLGVLTRGPEEAVLFLTVHHLIADLWSLGLLLAETEALYRQERGGPPAELPPVRLSHLDCVRWEEDLLASPRGERLWEFWRERLAGQPMVLDLPTDRPRPAARTSRGGFVSRLLPAAISGTSDGFCRANRATLYVTVLAAFTSLLHRHAGEERLLVGSPTTGRSAPETGGVVGYFINPLVVRSDVGGDPSFAAHMAALREEALGGFAHQDFPFPLLAERLQPERDPGRSPVFQSFFVMEQAARLGERGLSPFALGDAGARMTLAGLELESLHLPRRSAQFDLLLMAARREDGLALGLEYAADLFDEATAERWLDRLAALLAAAVEEPERRVSELPLLADAERLQVTADSNAAAAVEFAAPAWLAPGVTLDQVFAARAAAHPGHVAAVCGLDELTYGDLAARAHRLAHRLRALGVGPEAPVALLLERSLDLPVAILGVLAAGGAYVPLDPAYPAERLAFVLEDACRGAAAPVVVTRGEPAVPLPDGVVRVDLAAGAAELSRYPASPPAGPWRATGDGRLAYVIYTSGSTGKPKGVGVTHAQVVRLLAAADGLFDFGPEDVWTLFHSYAFDFSVWELWGALAWGGRVIVVPHEVALRPSAFRALLASEGVTVLDQTPAAFRQLVQAEEADDADPSDLADLRWVICGGEALDLAALRPWVARHGLDGPRLVNMYGITETTVHVTFRRLVAGDFAAAGAAPLGMPLPDLSLHLLDRRLQPVPPGVPGEIWVGGAGVARGYLGRPELTAERFLPDPFSPLPGARLYRSGDLARRRFDRDLEYLGRADHQVKVRGFRIELGEIEAALAAHPGVREAVVLAVDEAGDRRLVAWVVPRRTGELPEGLRDHLRRSLPDHMVPVVFVPVASLPLTRSGKVDRRALLGMDLSGAAPRPAGRPPETPTERRLAEAWRELLSTGDLSADDDFFERGGHSLLVTRLLSRVRDVFGVELPPARVFAAPTLAALAAAIDAEGGTAAAAGPPLAPVSRDGDLPLSFAQERLWFLDQLQPGSAVYNIPAAFRLRGRLSVPALGAALTEIARRHEALRTTFAERGGRPVQVAAPPARVPLPLVDLTRLPAAAREVELERLAADEARRPFDLASGPLLRVRLLRLRGAAGEGGGERAEEHAVLATVHHAVADGWSMGVLVRELGALYPAALAGAPAPLPEPPLQYGDYAVWQRRRLDGEWMAAEVAHWRGALDGAPLVLDLPSDRPRPAQQGIAGAQLPVNLSGDLAAAVRETAAAAGTTPFMVLLAAFFAVLHRWTGAGDLLAGSPVAGRNRRELEGLIGFFVNTLVLRAQVADDPPFSALLAEVRATTLDAYAHDELPFERLVEDLRPPRDLGRPPLVQVMLAHQAAAPAAELVLPGLALAPLPVDSGTAKLDLTLSLGEEAHGLAGFLEYATDLFDRATAERWLGHFETLLAGAAAEPARRVSELPLLSGAERRQLAAWNDTAAARPVLPVHRWVARQAARTPEAVAVSGAGASLTYRELTAGAQRLGGRLRAAGVGPEARVALFLDRSPHLVEAILGVWEAGGAYVPLDPTHPPARLALVLGEARPAAVVTERSLAGRLPDTGAPVLFVDGGEEEDQVGRTGWAGAVAAEPENLAYVLFTSGSTGRPKGVEVPHRALANFLAAMLRAPGLRASGADNALQPHLETGRDGLPGAPGDGAKRRGSNGVLLAVTTPAFDIAALELLLPLLAGGRVEMASREEAADPVLLAAAIARTRPSALQATPATWRMLLDAGWPGDPGLLALCGGEALPADLAARLLPRVRALWNLYGPTETTVWSAARPVARGDERRAGAIGSPVANTRLHVVDAHGRELPLGVSGELAIGGAGVARGYLGRPELTAERFRPDAFAAEPGARAYLTGDLVRRLPDGALDFLGRLDHQVKVRGFRIETGDVEAALAAHPEVGQAAVVVRAEGAGGGSLVAYLVLKESAAGAAERLPRELKSFLGERLPEFMVPSAFVVLPAFPLTPNGKLDRRALPAPGAVAAAGEHEPPATPAERALAAIWERLLERAPIGRRDSFFDLGGHSLLATRMLARVREEMGTALSLRELFAAPTLAELARAAERSAGPAQPAPPPIRRAARDRYRLEPAGFAAAPAAATPPGALLAGEEAG